MGLWNMYHDDEKSRNGPLSMLLLRSMMYLCKVEESRIRMKVDSVDDEMDGIQSLTELNRLLMEKWSGHAMNLISEIGSNLCLANLTVKCHAPRSDIDVEHFLKYVPKNVAGMALMESNGGIDKDVCLPSEQGSKKRENVEERRRGGDRNEWPVCEMVNEVPRRVLKDMIVDPIENGGMAKKKQRNCVYSREDYRNRGKMLMNGDEEENEMMTSNEFSTALDRYEEDLMKSGKKPSMMMQKRKKRHFQSPMISNNEEDGDEDERKVKKVSREMKVTTNDVNGSGHKKNELESEFKGVDQEIAERVMNEILDMDLNVHWDDISGLEDVKQILYEMVILPNLHPEMFRGLRAPPRGLLLFGPPGNGKTMIAKAIATEADMTFFSISASVLCSKWIGEGEKTMRALFAIARVKAPAFIFIDEIDSILCARSSEEHESSRRLKNEFLLQFDGATTKNDDTVIVMGATNRPFDLDDAARRRLPKRIYVPLPKMATRQKLLWNLLKGEQHDLKEREIDEISVKLDGYSCSDIHHISQFAAMGPVRDIMKVCDGQVVGELRPITYSDFIKAIEVNRPSVAIEECKMYEEFAEKFGTRGL